MATKAKKQSVITPVKKTVTSKKESTFSFSNADIIPLIIIVLYLSVDFIPNFGSADVMGAQWVYIVLINFLSTAFIFYDKKNSAEAITAISKNILSILYVSLFIMGGLSILAAINKIESYVTLARFAATIVAFFSMAILLFRRPHMFKYVAQILSIFLLIQSGNILNQFFTGLGTIEFNELVVNLKGNSGNKNIMAANLVFKMAFTAYCIYTFKSFGKIFNIIILTLAAMAVFFINARAAFVSLILISFLYLAYNLFEYHLKRKKQELLMNLGLFFLPLVFASILSQIVISNHLELIESGNKSVYGSITDRLTQINVNDEKSGRLMLWGFAVNTIKENPVLGVGYGNYKLALIPYEKTFSDEMFTTYHAHNDFLEITADTGILGGLLYLGLYLAMAFLTFKVIFSNASLAHKRISAFSLIAFSVYFIDAVFNFPVERPIMQIFFASIIAFNLSAYLAAKGELKKVNSLNWTRPVFAAIVVIIMVPTLYVTHSTYKSMVAQNKYNSDFLTSNPVYKSDEVVPSLPSIPNLNVFSFPIDAIKGRYYLAEKKYDKALEYLNVSSEINPYISYTEFIKGNLFLEINKLDSASFYAEKAFFMKPRAKSNYLLLNSVLARTGDTALANKAFAEAVKYKNEAWKWNEYINLMFNMGKSYKFLYSIADSASKQFPDDAEIQKKKQDLFHWQDQPR